MNRHDRRKAAATNARSRAKAISMAVAHVNASDDPTITGFTVISPNGEATYIDVDTARKMGAAPDGEPQH